MKKVLTLLFSFYLLALSVMPCGDQDDCDYTSVGQSIFPTTDHSDHEQDTEHCTPFCMCGCCGQTFTTQFYPEALADFSPVLSQAFLIYKVSFVSEVYLSIWQPPKIS